MPSNENRNQLHALLAADNDKSKLLIGFLREAQKTFQERRGHFDGLTTSVEFYDDERALQENKTEVKRMEETVYGKLRYVFAHAAQAFNLGTSKERTNTIATADLIVNGVTVAKDVPAAELLYLEKRMSTIRELLHQVPTLAPGKVWTELTTVAEEGVYSSPEELTTRTEKETVSLELSPATEKHAAQVQPQVKDVRVAKILKSHQSSAVTPLTKSGILARCDDIISATRAARMAANTATVNQQTYSEKLLAYILDGDEALSESSE